MCETLSKVLTYAKFESQREGKKMRWNQCFNKSQQIF